MNRKVAICTWWCLVRRRVSVWGWNSHQLIWNKDWSKLSHLWMEPLAVTSRGIQLNGNLQVPKQSQIFFANEWEVSQLKTTSSLIWTWITGSHSNLPLSYATQKHNMSLLCHVILYHWAGEIQAEKIGKVKLNLLSSQHCVKIGEANQWQVC